MSNLPSAPCSELPAPQNRRAWTNILTRRRLTEFERAILDPDLVSLRQELALLDLRIHDLKEQANEGETRKSWQEVRGLVRSLQSEVAKDDYDKDRILDLTTRLAEQAEAGLDERALWVELGQFIEQRRKTADTERKYEELHKVLIPATQLSLMFDELHGAILTCVLDRQMQLALLMELRARLNGETRNKKQTIPIVLPEAYLAPPPPDASAGEETTVDVEPSYEIISEEPSASPPAAGA